MNKNKNNSAHSLPLARDVLDYYGDTEEDKVFLRVFAKKVREIDEDVGLIYFPGVRTVVVHWKKVIVYKVILNEYNIGTVSLTHHINQIKKVVRLLKLGFLETRQVGNLAREAARMNVKLGKRMI